MKDPRLENGFINILKISSSSDGSTYHVFVSSLDGIERSEEATKVLNSAVGFVQKELGKRLRLRRGSFISRTIAFISLFVLSKLC